MNRFRKVFSGQTVIIGLSHLPPLPDYPGSPGIDVLRQHALDDLAVLQVAGFDGVLIENEYDRPHRVRAAVETVAAMTEIATAASRETGNLVVGCEILLNDPKASLDVASASGAAFIRTDYFVDRMSRPQYGEFDIDAEGLVNYRDALAGDDVLILADIQVKYATMIGKRSLQESAHLACLRGADAVIVTGNETGDAPTMHQLREARVGVKGSGLDMPVLIGSGLDIGNAARLLAECDGAIVGSALMRGGHVDASAAQGLMDAVAKTCA